MNNVALACVICGGELFLVLLGAGIALAWIVGEADAATAEGERDDG